MSYKCHKNVSWPFYGSSLFCKVFSYRPWDDRTGGLMRFELTTLCVRGSALSFRPTDPIYLHLKILIHFVQDLPYLGQNF